MTKAEQAGLLMDAIVIAAAIGIIGIGVAFSIFMIRAAWRGDKR